MPEHREGQPATEKDRQPEEAELPTELQRDRERELKGQDGEGDSPDPVPEVYRDIPGDRVGG